MSAELLKNLIQQYKTKETHFSPELSSETIALMQEESDLTFDFFTALTSSIDSDAPLDSLEDKIKSYLARRWAAIRKGNNSYTSHPFLPVNQLCLKIAEAIAQPDEAVCQILMPSIKGLNKKLFKLKAETEENGHFYPENFILNQDQTRLIPIIKIFEEAKKNTNTVFLEFQDNDDQIIYQLTGRDLLNLEQLAGDATKQYMQALRHHHQQRYFNNSIGFAINRLSQALKRGSREDSGTEDSADDEIVGSAIEQFYVLWPDIKTKISDLKYNHDISLYINNLFATHPGCPLKESELEQIGFFPCALQISKYLDTYLEQHPNLSEILMSEELGTKPQPLPLLEPLLDKAIDAIKIRGQSVNSSDKYLFHGLSKLIIKVLSSLPDMVSKIAQHVHSYQHLLTLLMSSEVDYRVVQAIIKAIESRLGQLTNVRNIYKLLLVTTEDQQQLIISSKFEEIQREMGVSFDYMSFSKTLKPKAKEHFKRLHAQRLASNIATLDDCHKTLKSIKQSSGLTLELIKQLSVKYSLLFTHLSGVMSTFALINWECQSILVEGLFNQLLQWINPENIQILARSLNPVPFSNLCVWLAKSIITRIRKEQVFLPEFYAELKKWRCFGELQTNLMDFARKHLPHITSGDALLSHISELAQYDTLKKYIYSICVENKQLIDNKTLFLACLQLIPEGFRTVFYAKFPAEQFVSEIADLEAVLTLLPPREREEVCENYDHEKINCSKEEWDNLLVKILPKPRKFESIINPLEKYIKKRLSILGYEDSPNQDYSVSTVGVILTLLDNPKSKKDEIIDSLSLAKGKLRRMYGKFSISYQLIDEALTNFQLINSTKPDLTSNQGKFFWTKPAVSAKAAESHQIVSNVAELESVLANALPKPESPRGLSMFFLDYINPSVTIALPGDTIPNPSIT